MKYSIFFLLLFIISNLYSSEKQSKSEYLKMRNSYLKLMETAHPQPDPTIKSDWLYGKSLPTFLALEVNESDFNNINTIESEAPNSQSMQNESSIAVNPTNPINLIASAVDYRDNSSTWVYVSDNGAKSWINKNLGKPFENWRSTNDPSVAFSADGTGYLMYGGFESDLQDGNFKGGNGIFIARTFNGGKTWEAHIPVVLHTAKQSLDSAFEDKYYVEVDNSPESKFFGRVYTPWKRVTARDSATQIMMAYSDDKGATWSDPIAVSPRLSYTSEDTTYGQSFPLLEAAPNGDLYCVWNNGIKHSIGFNKSTDGGKTWGEPKFIVHYNIFGITKRLNQGWRHTVKGKVRAEAYPVLRCDHSQSTNRGNLYLTWAADSIPNVYFSRSIDGGNTWSSPKIIHSDIKNDQFWQWHDIDPKTGEIAVMFFDSRRDQDNLLTECWVSLSADGGESWVDRPVGDIMADLRLNPFYGNFAGDYSGMAFWNGMVYPTWVDMRNAGKEINDSDVFTAIVDTRSPKPINNFISTIRPSEPTILELNWDCPNEYVYGQTLNEADYKIEIIRDGNKIIELNGGVSSYIDNNLTPHKEYKYSAIIKTNDGKSSIEVNTSNFAGGAKNPTSAEMISGEGYSSINEITINFKIPTKREDGTTPLSNLNKIALFRDNQFLKDIPLAKSDTGKTIVIKDTTSMAGWYRYHCIIKDNALPHENSSKPSKSILLFSGLPIFYNDSNSFSDNFDTKTPKKYYISGNWERISFISKSSTMSYSTAKSNKGYNVNQNDTLMLFPILAKDIISMDFEQIAAVHTSDKARLEYSYDDGKTWLLHSNWDDKYYSYWADTELNSQDWVHSTVKFDKIDKVMLIQFVFNSNPIKNQLGWYIDDLNIKLNSNNINEKSASKFYVYPNPADEFIIIQSSQGFNNEAIIYNYMGQQISTVIIRNEETKIDITSYQQGIYFVKIGNLINRFIVK